jgi:ParB/RepB/Spo0J family partition protein
MGRGKGGAAVLEAPPVDPMGEELAATPTPAADTVAPHQAETKGEYAMLPITAIAESPWNPRKHFDPKELAELTASVALDGVWEPVLVRPHASGHGVHELASGHRRFRAAKAAGLTEIPALIRPLDDETFLKLLTIANLQRENVHPLEQADAFALQMKQFGWKPDRIAKECGRGETFVYDHLKFLTLIDEVRELFFADRISTAHATELSRLKPEDQRRAIAVDQETGEAGGLWQPEGGWDDVQIDAELDAGNAGFDLKPKTVRELRSWIRTHVRFDAAAADPVLFPSVTEVAEARAEKVKVYEITRDSYVQPEAREGDVKTLGPRKWRRADGREGSAMCEFAAKTRGVIVVGEGQGDSFPICVAREKCKVHWAEEMKEKAKAAKQREQGSGGGGASTRAAKPKEDSWARQERLRAEANERLAPLVPELERLLAAKVKAASVSRLVDWLVEHGAGRVAAEDLKSKQFPRGKSADDFLRCLVWADVHDALGHGWDRARSLGGVCKGWGLDLKQIEKAHAPAAEKQAKKAPAKKKGQR